MSNPIRLPLTQRQAEALAKLLERFGHPGTVPVDEGVALREVAEKLSTLREGR